MAKQWQKLAAIKRKRISLLRTTTGAAYAKSSSTSSTVGKGHFVVYTADQRRFVIPLKYIRNGIIRELFRIAEDEFELPSCEPITLPCDAVFMEYVVTTKDVEKELVMSLSATGGCFNIFKYRSRAI